jgi:nicotinate dehydrogenase subunit B
VLILRGGALFEAIDFADGRLLNASLGQYRVPRLTDLPQIEVAPPAAPDCQQSQYYGNGEPFGGAVSRLRQALRGHRQAHNRRQSRNPTGISAYGEDLPVPHGKEKVYGSIP